MDAGDDDDDDFSFTESNDSSVEGQTRRRIHREDEEYDDWKRTFREPGNAIERLFTSTSNATTDILFHMFVTARATVTQMHRFCSVNSKARRACQREYLWLKMYWKKVIREPEVLRLNGREPETRSYIYNELMNTHPQAQWWTRYKELTKNNPEESPQYFLLLVALAYYFQVLEDRDDGFLSFNDGSKHVMQIMLAWEAPSDDDDDDDNDDDDDREKEKRREYMRLRSEGEGQLIMVDVEPEYVELVHDLTLVSTEDEGGSRVIIPRENTPTLIIRALKMNLALGDIEYPRSHHVPDALLKSCISCGSEAAKRACGGLCGTALYCGDECARLHWEAGHYKTCSATRK